MLRQSLCLMVVLLITGCGSSPAIPVNDQQTLVMESSVLAAGIRAKKPEITQNDGATVAQAALYNEQHQPVKVYYRFYWYDAKGLEIHPPEQAHAVIVPAQSAVPLYSTVAYPGARKVRLSLSL